MEKITIHTILKQVDNIERLLAELNKNRLTIKLKKL